MALPQPKKPETRAKWQKIQDDFEKLSALTEGLDHRKRPIKKYSYPKILQKLYKKHGPRPATIEQILKVKLD